MSTHLAKLRVASCPALEQQQHKGTGLASSCNSGSSSGAASGDATPVCGSGLSVSAAADMSASGSFLKLLIGKQSGRSSVNGR